MGEKLVDCRACPLWEGANVVPGYGPAPAEIMLVGEAPGANEDRQGRPFVGAVGVKLGILLDKAGIDPATVYLTNVLKHRPPKNRPPKKVEVTACAHWLMEEVGMVQPKIIIAVGASAINWFDFTVKLAQDHGRPRPFIDATESLSYDIVAATLVPMYHPAAALHNVALWPVMLEDWGRLRAKLSGKEPVTLDYKLATEEEVLAYVN